MTPEDIEAAATDLLNAESSLQQIGLLSVRHPRITLDQAYAVQAAQIAHKLRAGRRIIGWKIGLTSKVMQDALGITTPDSGFSMMTCCLHLVTGCPPGASFSHAWNRRSLS